MRRLGRYAPALRYLLFCLIGSASGIAAYKTSGALQWIYATLGVVMVALAFTTLSYDDAAKIADTSGEAWIFKINTASQGKHNQAAQRGQCD
jgi:hypothetical protein